MESAYRPVGVYLTGLRVWSRAMKTIDLELLATPITLLDAVTMYLDDSDLDSANRSLVLAKKRLNQFYQILAGYANTKSFVLPYRQD